MTNDADTLPRQPGYNKRLRAAAGLIRMVIRVRHGGRAPAGVMVRVLQRILALTAAIWHNDKTGQPVIWSLTAYDH